MKQVYIIVDKSDANFRKPFVAIAKNEAIAKQKVASMQHAMKPQVKHLVSYEAVDVSDYDMNKNSIYIVYDKTDANIKKRFMSMHFDLANVDKEIKALRSKTKPHAQKLIYTQMEKLI